jgi:hypothetical protein
MGASPATSALAGWGCFEGSEDCCPYYMAASAAPVGVAVGPAMLLLATISLVVTVSPCDFPAASFSQLAHV